MAKMTPEKAVSKHEARMHPDKPKTFKKGGPTTDDRMKYGKNMARAMNQKTG
jgi:hypothetical protein